MLTIEEIRERLKDRNLKEVSRRTGINYKNLAAIANGTRSNPTYAVLKPLCDYLEAK